MDYTKQLDYSSLSTFIDCPRKFFFQYIAHLRSTKPNIDLIFGSAWHYGLEEAYKQLQADPQTSMSDATDISIQAMNTYWTVEGEPNFPNPDIIFPKSPGHAANMYEAYWKKYYSTDQDGKIIGVEIPFNIPMKVKLSSSSNEYFDINYTGRIDLAKLLNGKLIIFDHKTAKAIYPITVSSFQSSLQTEGYLSAGKIYFDNLPRIVFNIALCQKSKIAFERIEIIKNDNNIERFLDDLKYHMTEIIANLSLMEYEHDIQDKKFNPTAFKRSCGYACTQYFRTCPYFDLCTMRNNPYLYLNDTPAGYKVEEWNPDDHDAKIKKLLNEVK